MTGDQRTELEREARVLARYLGVAAPAEAVVARYARACGEPLLARPDTPFDRFLLRAAARGGLALRAADVHARFFRPNALLRRRAITLLALLESTPATEQGLDRIAPTSPWRFAAGLALRGTLSVLLLALGALVFLPARLVHGTEERAA